MTLKKTWETVNHLMGKERRKLPSCMSFEDREIFNNHEIAVAFNKYFCNIAHQFAHENGSHDHSFRQYLPKAVPFSLFLQPTSTSEIHSVIGNLKMTSHVTMIFIQKFKMV